MVTKEPKNAKKEPEFNLDNENRYLVSGFKASKYYNPKLKGNDLKKALEEFKELGADPT